MNKQKKVNTNESFSRSSHHTGIPQFKIYVLFSSGGLIQIIMAVMTALLRPVGLVIEFSRDLFKLLVLKNP